MGDNNERGKREKRLGAEIAKEVGPKIGKRRERIGLSQEELAHRAGLHPTAVGLLETGKRAPRVVTLFVIAGVLGLTPAALLEGIYWEPGVDGDDGRFTDKPPAKAGE